MTTVAKVAAWLVSALFFVLGALMLVAPGALASNPPGPSLMEQVPRIAYMWFAAILLLLSSTVTRSRAKQIVLAGLLLCPAFVVFMSFSEVSLLRCVFFGASHLALVSPGIFLSSRAA